MVFLNIFELTFPLTDPVLKFLVILLIILFAPIILNKLKIPSVLGLIIAGAVIGPNGINLMERDSGIILSGTAGLLYIMFLAGLEINLSDFKKSGSKSFLFGMYTFSVPMILGFLLSFYVFRFSLLSSILFASMLASHTLIAYPIISKYGINKNRAVTVAVGGTMITDILALVILAVIVGMTAGEVDSAFWTRLAISLVVFASIVIFLFPVIARWFFKHFKDSVSQYIFVLAMVFLGAVLAEMAHIEGIIGAFLTGLSLNRLIPSTSSLMNRVEFVGNAIFIPFFLIGVGMLVDYKAFFLGFETIKVAFLMTVVAVFAKYAAAWLTQKSLKYTVDERSVIFGLSNAQAAATLAVVTVGYNIILGYTDFGDPIRLLNESVLNGSIIMILISCTIASFAAQKGARNISLKEPSVKNEKENAFFENILIPLGHPESIEELINLSTLLKKKENKHGIYALNVASSNNADPDADKKAHKILEIAQKTASASDIHLNTLLRYDVSVANAITGVIKENKVTDLIMGLHIRKELSESFLGNLTEHILENSNITTFIYKAIQPVATVKRHIVVIPRNAENELGFSFWVVKLWNLALNTGNKLIFYGTEETIEILKEVHKNNHIEAEFHLFDDWDDFLALGRGMHSNGNLIVVMSRQDKASYQSGMKKIPHYLNKYFNAYNFILIYPMQLTVVDENENTDLLNASLLTSMNKMEQIGKSITKALKGK